MSPVRGIRGDAIRAGALLAVLVAAPAGVLAQILADDGQRPALAGLLYLAVIVGFVLGGRRAARDQRDTPLVHGAVAALLAFAAVQGLGVLRRLATGNPVSPTGIVFAALLASTCGLLGGFLAARRHPAAGSG